MTSRIGLIWECVQQEDWHKTEKSIDRLCGRQRKKWTYQADDDDAEHQNTLLNLIMEVLFVNKGKVMTEQSITTSVHIAFITDGRRVNKGKCNDGPLNFGSHLTRPTQLSHTRDS